MKTAPTKITQANFARKLKTSRQFVGKLIDGDIITRLPDGRLNLEDSLARATAYLKSQAEATQLHSGKTALAAKKLSLQCQRLETEIQILRGKMHPADECRQGHIALRGIEARTLHALPMLLAAQFPEVPALKGAAAKIVDEVIERLRLADQNSDVVLTCPNCHRPVEELVAGEMKLTSSPK